MQSERISREESWEETVANYEALEEQIPALLADGHENHWVLLRDKKIVAQEYFATVEEALDKGNAEFPDERFSVQQIVKAPVQVAHAATSGWATLAV